MDKKHGTKGVCQIITHRWQNCKHAQVPAHASSELKACETEGYYYYVVHKKGTAMMYSL